MGFRGEALAAIASVSRIDLLTKTPGAISGTSIQLEAGNITEQSEAGCPDGTTIIVRDLFFNTPARMKFMKSDTVEGGKIAAAVQLQALAHPEVAFRFLRDGKEVLSTPGTGGLEAAVYCVYGRDGGKMVKVDSRWEAYSLSGYVSKPTDSRPSRNLQTFFVNGRPVKSRLLIAAFEEAYRNQLMVGKFPACVLHLQLPATAVDVNVHPAKTEVKFLNEKAVFDCIHYGVLGALNKTPDRPEVQFKPVQRTSSQPEKPAAAPAKQENFFRTMTPQEYKAFSAAVMDAPQPKKEAATATALKIETTPGRILRDSVQLPQFTLPDPVQPQPAVAEVSPPAQAEPEQTSVAMPQDPTWRMVGELYHTYILVEQDEEAFLIDKHAAHERILFEKLKANQEAISAQALLTPIPCRLSPDSTAILMSNKDLLSNLGFEIDEFGDNTVLLRQIPMDLSVEDAEDALDSLSADLLNGRQEKGSSVRDELLHTVACKAAIKAGWHTAEKELLAIAKQVMSREDLKYCPHGRPICVTLSKKQLEKQFKRS
jgi:DNA mismatch repair protein MutL